MNLINDLLLRTGILARFSQSERIQWFQGLRAVDILISLVIPLFIFVILAFCLKHRYNVKKQKDQITLNNFVRYEMNGAADWELD